MKRSLKNNNNLFTSKSFTHLRILCEKKYHHFTITMKVDTDFTVPIPRYYNSKILDNLTFLQTFLLKQDFNCRLVGWNSLYGRGLKNAKNNYLRRRLHQIKCRSN